MRLFKYLRQHWVIATCLAVTLPLFAVQLKARLFASKTDTFLRDLRRLDLKQSNFDAVQRLRKKYSSNSQTNGFCSPIRCDVSFTFSNWMSIVSVTDGPVSSRIRNRFFQVLGPLGLRFSTIDADVKVRRGKVIGVSARATTANPEIVDDGSWLFAVIGGGGTQWPFPLAPGEVFRVMQPSGCASCKAQYAVFTPEIDRDRYLRALTLNTDCFARVHACRDPNELMPQVSARDDLSQQVTPGCDLHNLHFAAQTNLSIFVAKVNKPPTAGAAPFELVKTFAAEMQDGVAVPTGDWQVSRNSILADQGFLRKYQNVLRPGNEVIVFGSTREKQAWDTCPVAPATAENLQAVWEGIQQVHELD